MLLCLSVQVNAQYFLTGQDAARTRWKQLKTPHFTLIFPDTYANRAQHTALLLEAAYPTVNKGLGAPPVRTPVVLHNQNAISNALVAWAPRRMDFFHVPPQDGYSLDWTPQLVLHELRHIGQMSRLETGFGKGLRIALGQQATGAMAGLFLPNWFMEGDAVWAETILSATGRGRVPLFSAGLKAQITEKGIYSYEKAWFGSYRDFTPDIYELGYHIVAYNSLKFGEQLWENAVSRSASQPWLIYPFSASLKKQTGMGVGKLYQATLDSLKSYWLAEADSSLTPFQRVSNQRNTFTNYRYPQITPYGIVALRQSLDDLSRIVLIDSLGEQVLFTPHYVFPEGLSARNDLVVWNEYQPDLRWSNRAYSVIKLGSISRKKVWQLSHRSYYYAPDLNHSGSSIAVSEVMPDGSSAIVVLDAASGQELSRYSSEKYFIHQPKWLTDDEHIAFLATGNSGKSLWLLNLRSMHAVQYTPFVYTDFHLSSAGDGLVYLHGAWNGKQEAYVFEFATQVLRPCTRSNHAAADPAIRPDGQKLVYANYTADGWMLVEATIDNASEKPVKFANSTSDTLLGIGLPADRFAVEKLEVADTIFPVRPYRRAAKLFNLHSWAPFYVDAATQQIRPGLSLMSQNSLSTMVATAGYDYDSNEGAGKSVFNLSYYGLFPVIDASISHGRRKGTAHLNDTLYNLRWNETQAGLQFSVPLNFTRNRWQRGLNLSSGFDFIQRRMDEDVGLNFKQEYTTAINYNLLAYNLDRRSMRDIYPRTGQVLRVIFRHSPFDESPGDQLFTSFIAYLPGLAAHHGIRAYLARQRQNSGFYNFGSYVSVPRGQSGIFARNIESYKLDYAFPLAYPDYPLGPIIYVKRLRANVFHDIALASSQTYQSTGFEIWADAHLLRMQAPVGIGFRLSYNSPGDKIVPEMVFGIDWNAVY